MQYPAFFLICLEGCGHATITWVKQLESFVLPRIELYLQSTDSTRGYTAGSYIGMSARSPSL
jgi:hypothetical protein